MKKPAQGKVFKGWVTTDGGNTWLPHFAKLRDPDPTVETYEAVIFEKTRGNKDCPCPCYCDNTTPTNIHLQVPSSGRNDRARSPSPGALNHFTLHSCFGTLEHFLSLTTRQFLEGTSSHTSS